MSVKLFMVAVTATLVLCACAPSRDRYEAANDLAEAKMEAFRKCMTLPDGSMRPDVRGMRDPCAEEMMDVDWAIDLLISRVNYLSATDPDLQENMAGAMLPAFFLHLRVSTGVSRSTACSTAGKNTAFLRRIRLRPRTPIWRFDVPRRSLWCSCSARGVSGRFSAAY
jgi:hypothetical protein